MHIQGCIVREGILKSEQPRGAADQGPAAQRALSSNLSSLLLLITYACVGMLLEHKHKYHTALEIQAGASISTYTSTQWPCSVKPMLFNGNCCAVRNIYDFQRKIGV